MSDIFQETTVEQMEADSARERNHEQEVDLDDLIFDEDDGYPSER